MAETHRIGLDEVARHFEELEDPRSTVNRRHPLVSVVVIALMAVLAGADGPTSIAEWAARKEEFLLEAARLAQRDSAQGRLSSRFGPAQAGRFSSLFCQLAAIVARDGRGDRWRQPADFRGRRQDGAAKPRSWQGPGALHSVSVWASEFGLSLGQVACAKK